MGRKKEVVVKVPKKRTKDTYKKPKTEKEILEAVFFRKKVDKTIEEEPTDEELHQKNVALAKILTLFTTEAAKNISTDERLDIKKLVQSVLTKTYRYEEGHGRFR